MSNEERNEEIGREWINEIFAEPSDEQMEAVITAGLIEAFWWDCIDEFEAKP